jgi:hypothetical protein
MTQSSLFTIPEVSAIGKRKQEGISMPLAQNLIFRVALRPGRPRISSGQLPRSDRTKRRSLTLRSMLPLT